MRLYGWKTTESVFLTVFMIKDDKNHRCISYEGEITFDNYVRIDNSDKAPDVVAQMIKDAFNL